MNLKKILSRKLFSHKHKKAISASSIEERFKNIYKDKIWYGNKESYSGSGSTLEATEKIRLALPRLIKELQGKVLVDIGCGDYNWMKEIDLPCKYIGIDIVKEIVTI